MLLSHALRLRQKDMVTLVGGGGKTTLMFRLAAELAAADTRVVTTITTRMFVSQMDLAPARLVLAGEATLLAQLPQALADHRHVLVVGSTRVEADKVAGISPALVDRIAAQPVVDAVLVEADGSRCLPFKAPAAHEPVIPARTTILVPVAGLDVLGAPLSHEHVHRPELVSALSGTALGDPVTPATIAAVLGHPEGGARGLPPGARLVPFLNKADDEARLNAGRQIARLLLAHSLVDSVLIGAGQATEPVYEVWNRTAAVVLAAGRASRYGSLKQLLPWRGVPLVAHVADQALACADVDEVVVTTGAEAGRVQDALGNRRVRTVQVSEWEAGQSRSVKAGLDILLTGPDHPRAPLGAVLFLLADQPGISPALLSALIQRHRETLAPVVVPRFRGQRGNPALFDRQTFPEFPRLYGDVGARPILDAHAGEIAWLDWATPEITRDIDRPEDYLAETGRV